MSEMILSPIAPLGLGLCGVWVFYTPIAPLGLWESKAWRCGTENDTNLVNLVSNF